MTDKVKTNGGVEGAYQVHLPISESRRKINAEFMCQSCGVDYFAEAVFTIQNIGAFGIYLTYDDGENVIAGYYTDKEHKVTVIGKEKITSTAPEFQLAIAKTRTSEDPSDNKCSYA